MACVLELMEFIASMNVHAPIVYELMNYDQFFWSEWACICRVFIFKLYHDITGTYLADCDVSRGVAIGNHPAQGLLGVHVVFEFGRVLEGEGADVNERILLF